MPTPPNPQDFERLYELLAGKPSGTVTGAFHRAANVINDPDCWATLAVRLEEAAALAREIADAAR